MPNKVDLVFDKKEKRQVTEEQIKDYARVNDLLYLGECSAKNDINVSTTLDALIKQIYFRKKRSQTLRDVTGIRRHTTLGKSTSVLCGQGDGCGGCFN